MGVSNGMMHSLQDVIASLLAALSVSLNGLYERASFSAYLSEMETIVICFRSADERNTMTVRGEYN